MSYRARATLQIGFAAASGSIDPAWSNNTWTDVSTYMLAYDVKRGSAEFDGITPGTGTITLDNPGALFDPSNTGSTYYGQMLDGKPVQILEQVNLLSLACSIGEDPGSLVVIGGVAIIASTTQAHSGPRSLRLTTSGAGAIGFTTPAGLAAAPTTPGEPITVGAWIMRTSATNRSATVSAVFYSAAGAVLSTVPSGAVNTSGAWQQMLVQTVAPANSAFVALRVDIAASVIGDVHYVDDLMVVPSTGPGASTWFPGGPISVFKGQIDSWLPVQMFPGDSTCELQVSGSFQQIASVPTDGSLWSTFVGRLRPDLWWRLGETDETTPAWDSSGNGRHGRYVRDLGGTPISFTDGLVNLDSDGAVNLDATWRQYIEGPGIAWPSTVFTVALWIKGYPAASACTLFDSSRLSIAMTAAGQITVNYLGLVATTTSTVIDVRDGRAHLIFVSCTAGAVTVTVDQDFVGSATAAGILGAERTQLRTYVGRDQTGTVSSFATITIDEVLIWFDVTIDNTWLYLCGVACSIRPNDLIEHPTPAQLAQFLINMFGSPRPLAITDVPIQNTMVIDVVPMSSALEMLNTAAIAGQLTIYEARDGTPTIGVQSYVAKQGSAFLGIAPTVIGLGAGEFPYAGTIPVDFGEASQINMVTVDRPNIASLTFRNQSSINARGPRPTSITLWSTVERCARDLATWLLAQYGSTVRRLGPIQPDCTRIDTLQAMLWLEINDVILVKDLTVDGRTISTLVRVTGIETARTRDENGLPVLSVTLTVSNIRVQPIVLDSTAYGVLAPAANPGKWGF